MMKNSYKLFTYIFLGLTIGFTSCQIDEFGDPNNPSVDQLTGNPVRNDLQVLLSGIESGMRNRIATYYDAVSVIGREYWRFSGSDPRFTSDLLGEDESVLDNNTFYTTNPYFDRYRVVKNCNLLLDAINNTSIISEDEKANLRGVANTIKAYQLSLVLNQQFSNGIRIDVADPNNLGPFRSFTEALGDIAALLDEAAGQLGTGSVSSFAVGFSSGFEGFDTPATFLQFNRAIAARIALYREDYAGALTILQSSFFDLNGDLNVGPAHFFSTAGGDVTNPMFFPQNATGDLRVTHPTFFTDAEGGDTRVAAKTSLRDNTASLDNLSGDYDLFIYQTNTDFIPIIRNEELILIYAEANIQTNNTADAVTALNTIRSAAGLADYAGATDAASLINEMLTQRRYSLLGEGHRWVDMRRYNRLGELPIDRAGDDVFMEFPRPASEAE